MGKPVTPQQAHKAAVKRTCNGVADRMQGKKTSDARYVEHTQGNRANPRNS